MTTLQRQQHSPIAHLSDDDIENLGRELDAIRQEVLDSRGERDAAYIRNVIDLQRKLELGSRGVLLFSLFPPAWLVGTVGLSVAKIIENMEIGHNVMHGQWDWMRDNKIHSTTWEWDNASPSDMWKHSHNEMHHTYTNVVGKDERPRLRHHAGRRRPTVDAVLPRAAAVELRQRLPVPVRHRRLRPQDRQVPQGQDGQRRIPTPGQEGARQDPPAVTKDYVLHPLLSGPSAVTTLTANLTANLVRNLWTHSVIMCGHFPEGVQTYEKKSIDGETRGEWYLRQMLGSANISGSRLLHFMTGNLSFQIEHHLFPDLPSNRYQEIAPKIQDVFERYGLTYVSGPMVKQVGSAWKKVFRLSLPNDFLHKATAAVNPTNLVQLVFRSESVEIDADAA